MKVPRTPIIFIFLSALALLVSSTALAADSPPSQADVIRGAQLFDRWYAVLGVDPPQGDMPIWSRQTTNTRSGADTWRCSECHGWDYQGAQGAYSSGSHYTGFPDLLTQVQGLTIDDIVGHLNGNLDPAHDFSAYMDNTSLTQLADFLKYGLIDDNAFINPISLHMLGPDLTHGQQLYQATCLTCHGADGTKIVLSTEGINEFLGTIANRDPWRFLHRTRFGVAGTDMPVGLSLGWSPADGRDVLAYAQSLPTGGEIISEPTANPQSTPAPLIGGPATNLWTGILTSLGTMAGAVLVSLGFIGGFILISLMVVIILRRRGDHKS